jgi:hypothetical protein
VLRHALARASALSRVTGADFGELLDTSADACAAAIPAARRPIYLR